MKRTNRIRKLAKVSLLGVGLLFWHESMGQDNSYRLPYEDGTIITVTQGCHYYDPDTNGCSIDFQSTQPDGTTVLVAPRDGVLTNIVENSEVVGCDAENIGKGNVLWIEHTNADGTKEYSVFHHIVKNSVSKFNLQQNAKVIKGQSVALEGNTGYTCNSDGTAPAIHLHYERRDKDGKLIQLPDFWNFNTTCKKQVLVTSENTLVANILVAGCVPPPNIITLGLGYFPKGASVTYQEVGGDCSVETKTCIVEGTTAPCNKDIFKAEAKFCDEDYRVNDEKTEWIPSSDWTDAVKIFGYTAKGKELISGVSPTSSVVGTTKKYNSLSSFNKLTCQANERLYLPFKNLTLGDVLVIASNLVKDKQEYSEAAYAWFKNLVGDTDTNPAKYPKYNAETFHVDTEITRDLAIAILVNIVNKGSCLVPDFDNEGKCLLYMVEPDIITNKANKHSSEEVQFNDLVDNLYKAEIETAMKAGLIRNTKLFNPKGQFLRYQIAQVAVLIKNLIDEGTNTILYADRADILMVGLKRICSISGGRTEEDTKIRLQALSATPIPDGAVAFTTNFGTIKKISASEIEWTAPEFVKDTTRVVITVYNDVSVYSYITTVYPTKVVTPPPSNVVYASDYPNDLQAGAIAAKNKTLVLSPITYKVKNLVLDDVTVIGLDCGAIIDGQGLDDVIQIKGTVKLSGVTVINSRQNNGNRAGIVVSGNSNLEMLNVLVKDNFIGVRKNGAGKVIGHHITMENNSDAQFRVNGSGEVTLTDVKYIGSSIKVDKNGESGSVSITEGQGFGVCVATVAPVVGNNLVIDADLLKKNELKGSIKVKSYTNKKVKVRVRLLQARQGGRTEDEILTEFSLNAIGEEKNVSFEKLSLSEGDYSVVVEYLEGTEYKILAKKDFTVVAIILNIDDVFMQGFKLYPNPATNSLIITNANKTFNTITITNLLGQEVLKVTTQPTQRHVINVETLSADMYLIIIESEGQKVVMRFVKQ